VSIPPHKKNGIKACPANGSWAGRCVGQRKRCCLSHAAGMASCAARQTQPRGSHRNRLFSLDLLLLLHQGKRRETNMASTGSATGRLSMTLIQHFKLVRRRRIQDFRIFRRRRIKIQDFRFQIQDFRIFWRRWIQGCVWLRRIQDCVRRRRIQDLSNKIPILPNVSETFRVILLNSSNFL